MDAIYVNYFYSAAWNEFKLQILQCILTSDPITMKKNKRKPITFVINKQANKNVGSLR